ncbi:MAG: hypothetical protein ABI972_13705 [Acidobacteriota bacterium]
MEYFVGIVLALAIAGLAAGCGFYRDRSFGPTVLIVIAAYYVLFAVMGSSGRTIVVECIAAAGFVLAAMIGFKASPLLVAAAIASHGLFDFTHYLFIDDPGVPHWWPGFCGTVDILLGASLALLHMRDSRTPQAPGVPRG